MVWFKLYAVIKNNIVSLVVFKFIQGVVQLYNIKHNIWYSVTSTFYIRSLILSSIFIEGSFLIFLCKYCDPMLNLFKYSSFRSSLSIELPSNNHLPGGGDSCLSTV